MSCAPAGHWLPVSSEINIISPQNALKPLNYVGQYVRIEMQVADFEQITTTKDKRL